MTSFSQQLEALLESNVAIISESDELFFAELEAAKQWLSAVFADEKLELLGYIGNPRFLDGTVHPLEVYMRVNDLFFCLKLGRRKSSNKLTVAFQLGYLHNVTNENGRRSCFQKVGSLYKESESYKSRLDFHLLGKDGEWPKLPSDDATLTELRTALVATCFNALKHKQNLRKSETIERLEKELFEKPKFTSFDDKPETSEVDPSVVQSGPFVLDEAAYFTSLDNELLDMPIRNLLVEENATYLQDGLKLTEHEVVTVRDLISLTYLDLGKISNYKGSYIRELAKHDLELKPDDGSDRLAPGIPKSVDLLLSTSGLDYIDKPGACLSRGKVFSTRELIDKTPDDLLAMTNFGEKSLEVIKEALKMHGLALRPDE